MTLRLAIQTSLLPGGDPDAWMGHAARLGFAGVELHHGPAFDIRREVEALARASEAHGVAVAAICTTPALDPVTRETATRNQRVTELIELVDAASALGAAGVVSVPIRRGAPFDDARLPELAIDIYQRIGSNLGAGDAAVFLEPLNRYEATFLNRVGQAAMLARMVGQPRVQALADLFHMHLEETRLDAPIDEAGALLGHVHIADSTRDEPGTALMNLHPAFSALRRIGYGGWVSLECRGLTGDPHDVLPASIAHMRRVWAEAGDGHRGVSRATGR